MLIGHRGAPGYRPEHTSSSYELALDLGVDAVEPDLVPTKDGVLVVRHEPEIGTTTDVSRHPEFSDRRVTKVVDGVPVTGWFTEDFTWEELSALRCRERLPYLRPANRAYDDRDGVLRFSDLLDLLERHNAGPHREVGLVAEIKHPGYFAAAGFDMPALTQQALAGRPWGGTGSPLWIECFERSALTTLRRAGSTARLVYLIDESGAAPDDVATHGDRAAPYSDALTEEGLADLSELVDGISPAWQRLIGTAGAGAGRPRGVVEAAHAVGLSVFTWTLRPENQFLAEPWRLGLDPARRGRWREQFAALIATGVDGVFADHPDLVA